MSCILIFRKISVALLLSLATAQLLSQEIIDYATVRASYQFLSKTNVEQTDFQKHDLIYVDIGTKVTKSYSRFQQQRDSVTRDALRQGFSVAEIREAWRNFRVGDTFSYFHWHNDNKTTVAVTLVAHGFVYEEPTQIPKWTITDEDKEILGYLSKKATAHYLGREWIAYFASEIPINQGPWKLWGLPGLIVEAYDSENLFKFELNGFEQVPNVSIVFENTRPGGTQFQEIGKAEFIRLEKVLYSDFAAFFELMPGGPLVMERRPTQTNVDFIPLEPWN
jgi:GLPGLI family protein